MNILKGLSISRGCAIGAIKIIKKTSLAAASSCVEDVSSELLRFEKALGKVSNQLSKIEDLTRHELGDDAANIIASQKLILMDDIFINSVTNIISSQHVDAEYAVSESGRQISDLLAEMDDDYLSQRSVDVLDITKRILRVLSDSTNSVVSIFDTLQSKYILLSEELTPSEILQYEKSQLLALVTQKDSVYSHTAILAREMDIPALVVPDMDINEISDGMLAIVDSHKGQLILNPDESAIEYANEIIKADIEESENLINYKDETIINSLGKNVLICANIGDASEVESVLKNGGDGIGLFRSEFLFIGREKAPSEEEQFEIYRSVLEAMADRKVVVRTLDISDDKQAEYLKTEDNHDADYESRDVALYLKNQDVFEAQIRALLRAACFGNLSIMYPMITSEAEIDEINRIVEKVSAGLERDKIPFAVPKQGIMIETQNAVDKSLELAHKVDFFSIGTNDLCRSIGQDGDLQQPVIMKWIKTVIDNAHKADIRVSICGELAADTSLTDEFILMGIDELSVNPSSILRIRGYKREEKH